jgi:glycosyltransferase involved in cell wall biosynthesis
MTEPPGFLVAQAVADAVPFRGSREALRVAVSSLARGGAERIVIEWLAAERGRGREVELAVLHRRRHEYCVPDGIAVLRRGDEAVEKFVEAVAGRWASSEAPVSTHLVGDALLARLWAHGVRTVPVIHNVREAWRNDPASWRAEHVPFAVACAEAVRRQALEAGCVVPVVTLRHRPAVGPAATDSRQRERIRAALGIAPDAFVVGAVGALKSQKDYPRAIDVLASLRRSRDAVLVILGGALDGTGLAELDRIASRACAHGVAHALRLPGSVDPVDPWYAAFDALLNVSRHEGLSMATAEALAAGLPVVAADVGGQREIVHGRLALLPAGAPADAFARALALLPVRRSLAPDPSPRHPRAWTVSTAWRRRRAAALDTLFVTANLNAGGAQRSLVNLAVRIAGRHRFALAVGGECTHPAFPARLVEAAIECFRPSPTADPFDVAEGVLARATASGARNLCFWNADPRVKLLVGRFAPPGLRLVDASPGAYAYEELESAAGLGETLAFGPQQYYRRLDVLVTKYDDRDHPSCRRVAVIPNGVALRDPARKPPAAPRFVVSGRIAPSKRLETVLEAFARLPARFPGARLDLVGQAEPRHRDYLETLLDRAAGLPVAFRGAHPDLAFLDEPFTAAVVLGTHQGSPNAVLEAMAAGLAVIANASGGTGELVRAGETGWLLSEACTADELARAMAEAAADAMRAKRFGLAGREHVLLHHSLDGMALRYLSLFEADSPARDETPDSLTHGCPQLHPA